MTSLLRKHLNWVYASLLVGLLCSQWQCANSVNAMQATADADEMGVFPRSPNLDAIDDGLNCDTTLDGDCDGVWTDCDADDTDPGILMAKTCDDDRDGYADEFCRTYADEDGDGVISSEERAAYGYNCDVCPLDADTNQTDSNGDGMGDLCSPAAVQEPSDTHETLVADDSADIIGESESSTTDTETKNNRKNTKIYDALHPLNLKRDWPKLNSNLNQ